MDWHGNSRNKSGIRLNFIALHSKVVKLCPTPIVMNSWSSECRNDICYIYFWKMSTAAIHCLECGKAFCNQGSLTRHKVVHTQEKNYQCSECGKAFGQKSKLKTHMVVHTQEKNYQCSECGKAFAYKESLTRHNVIHTKEKNYQCSECGKAFGRKSGLKHHLQHCSYSQSHCTVSISHDIHTHAYNPIVV